MKKYIVINILLIIAFVILICIYVNMKNKDKHVDEVEVKDEFVHYEDFGKPETMYEDEEQVSILVLDDRGNGVAEYQGYSESYMEKLKKAMKESCEIHNVSNDVFYCVEDVANMYSVWQGENSGLQVTVNLSDRYQ